MTTTTKKNRLARGATAALITATAFAAVLAGPASAAVGDGVGAGSVRTLLGPPRHDRTAAVQDIPGLESTCRNKYRGWPTNSRVATGQLSGRPATSTAFVDCPPPR